MGCRHAKDNVCLILNNNGKCGIFNQDEERCSKQNGAIIWYLKTIGTYDEKVKNNPQFLNQDIQIEDFQQNTMHELKILPKYFKPILDGTKNFELRKNDRDFKVGDDLLLQEYAHGMYTGRKVYKRITYIFKGGEYGLDKDYVILSLKEDNSKMY